MKNRGIGLITRIGSMVLAVMAIVAALVAYSYLKPTTAASGPIQAIAIETATTTAATALVFEIDQATSEARYVIDEVLRGTPVTVVGATDQVAGQLALDLSDVGSAQLGTIQINARDLTTDATQRDQAVRNRILMTDEYEYITFTPTDMVGLPATLATGETATFQVAGDLTLRDVTRPATFDVTLTPISAERLAGSATTTIRFADWEISVPSVPSVTGLSDQVRLELTFEAAAA